MYKNHPFLKGKYSSKTFFHVIEKSENNKKKTDGKNGGVSFMRKIITLSDSRPFKKNKAIHLFSLCTKGIQNVLDYLRSTLSDISRKDSQWYMWYYTIILICWHYLMHFKGYITSPKPFFLLNCPVSDKNGLLNYPGYK